MRPGKVILCVDPDTTALSSLVFTLTVRGFRVFSAENEIDALATFATEVIDLVICDCTTKVMKGRKLVACMKGIKRHIPMILLAKKSDMEALHVADAMLSKDLPMLELIDRVKVMSARKRGPRLGSHRKPPCSVAVLEEAAVA